MPTRAISGGNGARLGRTGLQVDDPAGRYGLTGFADAVLRGVAQVIFLNNSYTGLLCLIGIFLHSPVQCAAALVGTVAGTAVGLLVRAEAADVRSGLYGYNGCLVGMALPLFLGGGAAVWLLAVTGAGLSSLLLLALRRHGPSGFAVLTAPFVLCSWVVILLFRALNPVGPAGAGSLRDVPVPAAGVLADWTVVEGALAGLAQVYLQPSALSGLVIAVALLVGSRAVFLVACLSGLVSAAVASVAEVPQEAIRTGLFGFNAVLAGLALGVVYLRTGRIPLVLAAGIAAAMPLYQILCAKVLMSAGLPTMSVPFITATWLTLLALRPFDRLWLPR